MINKIKNFWFELSDKIRFVLVGGFNFVVSYLIYSGLLYFLLGESLYQTALILAWVISSVISFTTQRFLVFPVRDNILKQYFKCCIIWFFSYMINAFLLEFLVSGVHINPYAAQIIATAGCAVFTYIMFKLYAFCKKEEN